MELRWEQRWAGTNEVARVDRLADDRWCAEVARHMRDFRRRKQRIFASKELAMTSAEQWTRASLERIQSQLPRMVDGRGCKIAEWPASNPEP
jgi:hypothetical protein